MPDHKRLDPFKPQQPNIPGVPPGAVGAAQGAPPKDAPSPKQAQPFPARIAGILVAALVIAISGGWWIHRAISAPAPPVPDAAAQAAIAEETSNSAKNLPIGPGEIATTDELEKTWSAKRFLFQDSGSNQTVAAMVVRLPGGGYWGFSLREPYGKCELEYVTDLQKLEREYGFQASHPMVGNPCSHVVYDLLRYGGAADALVRGDIVHGNGVRPPLAIEIETRGKQVRAIRME